MPTGRSDTPFELGDIPFVVTVAPDNKQVMKYDDPEDNHPEQDEEMISIGGIFVNDNDEPIEGVQVLLLYDKENAPANAPRQSIRVVSDVKGHWHSRNSKKTHSNIMAITSP